tara:strand:- start:57 stop:209 length:153 start_codon:yes stop_codon:yes gene_type:complete
MSEKELKMLEEILKDVEDLISTYNKGSANKIWRLFFIKDKINTLLNDEEE